ncbi:MULTISPECIES: hypothetical protein [Streptococcus]|uniref:hypothetical protein n=1 Tax=Streptococcus TaxID=1301 RepID=UPI000B1D8704|nr:MULTISPECIES: hypothetical protein [Streptococcus]RSK12339.1 hypothetical protein D8784_000407 [Streptococcus australis]
MKKFTSLTLLLITTIILIACTSKSLDSLDGEYYWISSERNELAITIKGDNSTIGQVKLTILQQTEKTKRRAF